MVKYIAASELCGFICHKYLLRIPFITIQRYATYFFYCIFFSKHVHVSVCPYACLWDYMLPFFVYFHSVLLTYDWTYDVF